MNRSRWIAGFALSVSLIIPSARAEHDVLDRRFLNVIPYYEYVPAETSMPRQQGQNKLTGRLTVRRIKVTPTPVLVTKRVLVGVKCSGGVVGDGSDGEWYGFFEAPMDRKADALAKAVKGIGPPTAQRIVNSKKFFKRKPRSWKEFEQEITAIHNELNVKLISTVLDQYGADNMKSLGYRSKTGTCEDIFENRQYLDFEEVRTEDGQIRRDIEVNIAGGSLLKTESDSFSARMYIGPQGEQIVSVEPPGHHNTYQFNKKTDYQDATVYDFSARRNQIRPEPGMVSVTPRVENGKLQFRIVNNGTEAGGNVTVRVSTSVKKGLLKSSQAESSFTLNGADGSYDTGSKGDPSKTYYYTYSVEVSGSPYYNGERSQAKSESAKP